MVTIRQKMTHAQKEVGKRRFEDTEKKKEKGRSGQKDLGFVEIS